MTWPIHIKFPNGDVNHLEVKPGAVVLVGENRVARIDVDPILATQDREKIRALFKRPSQSPELSAALDHLVNMASQYGGILDSQQWPGQEKRALERLTNARLAVETLMDPAPPAPKVLEFVVHIKAPPPPPPVDEFEAEARRLLKDDGTRSWEDVERDVAAALRARAGG